MTIQTKFCRRKTLFQEALILTSSIGLRLAPNGMVIDGSLRVIILRAFRGKQRKATSR